MSLGSSTACCHPESRALPPPALGAGIEPVPVPAAAPGNQEGSRDGAPGLPCRQRPRDSASVPPQPPRKNKAGRMIPSCGRGRRGGGFAVICGGSVCSEVPPPAAALAGHPCGPRPIPGAGMQRRCSESRGLRPQQLPERLL